MAALVTSILVSVLMTFGIFAYAKRRPVDADLTWGEAMVGSVYVFTLCFLVYGIVPHQWLTLAENEWGFRADKIVYGWGDIVRPISEGGHFPFDITLRAVSDAVAAGLYIVFVAGQVWLWAWWQKRAQRAKEAASSVPEIDKSTYGRPLVKRG